MEEQINKVVKLIKKRNLFFFVGAAISLAKPSQLLSFLDLQNEIIWALCRDLEGELKISYEHIHKEIKNGIISSKIAKKFMNIAPEYVFQLCKQEIICENETPNYYALEPLGAFRGVLPNQNHLFLAKLLINEYIPAIFTPNFDLLIESAIQQLREREKSKVTIKKYWRPEQFKRIKNTRSKIFKLHGCIDDLDSIVISLHEIGKRCTFQKLKILRHFLENYYAFFSGYRGADLDIFNYIATTKCKGIIWNALSEQAMIPKVKRMLEIQKSNVIIGNLCDIFKTLSSKLNFGKLELKSIPGVKKREFSQDFCKWASRIKLPSKIVIMGDLWEYLGEWRKAIEFFGSGFKLAKKSKNKHIENLFLGRLAGIFYKTGKYLEARDSCKLRLDNAKDFPPLLRLSDYIVTLQLIGLIKAQTDIKKAINLFTQSLEYQEELEKIDKASKSRKSDILLNVGNVFYRGGCLDEAIKCYKSALKIYDEFGDVHGRARTLSNIGNVLLHKNKFDDCIFFYRQAEYLFDETGDIFELSRILLNLAIAYYKKRINQRAREYAYKALEYFNILSDRRGSSRTIKLIQNLK